MPTPQDDPLIREWSKRFRQDPLAAGAIADLSGRGDEIWQRAFELLRRESPEYRNAIDDEFTRESKMHCSQLLRTIVAIATGRAAKSGCDVFAFVRAHAEWRARHGVPLIASLHAYRLAHRTYSGLTCAPLLAHSQQKAALLAMTMLSDFWIELFDHVGAVLAEAHAVVERITTAQNTHAYTALIDSLLRGVPPTDAEDRRLCALCGIRAGVPLAVIVLRPRGGGSSAIDRDAALRSLVRLLDEALPHASFGKLIAVRSAEVAAIICSDKGGRGAIEALRRNGFVRRTTNGSAADIGVSRDITEIVQLSTAIGEAHLAADFTQPSQPVMHFSDIDLAEYLIRRADDAAFRLVPDWVHHFDPDEDPHAQELRRTIRAFADCNLNVKQTARRVGVHINTVYFRLNRIKKLTGVDPRTYSGTVFLLTALRLQEIGYHHKKIR